VQQRRTALQTLDMQHNFFNLRVDVDEAAETATARCNYSIHRFHPSSDGLSPHSFHSCGHYIFAFAHASGSWRISRITQNLLREYGDLEIHGAARASDVRVPASSVR
jgi:hypothetical protein